MMYCLFPGMVPEKALPPGSCDFSQGVLQSIPKATELSTLLFSAN